MPFFPLRSAPPGDRLLGRLGAVRGLSFESRNGKQVKEIAAGDQGHRHLGISRQRGLQMPADIGPIAHIPAHRIAIALRRRRAFRGKFQALLIRRHDLMPLFSNAIVHIRVGYRPIPSQPNLESALDD